MQNRFLQCKSFKPGNPARIAGFPDFRLLQCKIEFCNAKSFFEMLKPKIRQPGKGCRAIFAWGCRQKNTAWRCRQKNAKAETRQGLPGFSGFRQLQCKIDFRNAKSICALQKPETWQPGKGCRVSGFPAFAMQNRICQCRSQSLQCKSWKPGNPKRVAGFPGFRPL